MFIENAIEATTPAFNQQQTTEYGVINCLSETIGNTPLLKLNKYMKQCCSHANLMAKLEYFNPMSSIKDRPALAMIERLVKSPEFSNDTHIIEATSGNNGVACAWLCAIYNIPLTIVIPEHMSIERQKLIKHFGGRVVTTEKSLGTKGAIDHAKKLVASDPTAVMLDQFANQANPTCHANSTALEIYEQTSGTIDVLVTGVGTGGTLTGTASFLKDKLPNIEIIAVEPQSCPVLSEGRSGVHKIQGLSSGHVPDILDLGLIDEIVTVSDQDAIETARKLAISEGVAAGISSGATLCAATQIAQQPQYQDKNIVVIIADTAERYYSTELFTS